MSGLQVAGARLKRILLVVGLAVGIAGLLAPAARAQVEREALIGTWSGFYNCAQGQVALTLTVEPGRGRLEGVFAFGPHAGNPDIPGGSYAVNVFGDPTGFGVTPGSWIEQPPGYFTVGLEGSQDQDGALTGRVMNPSCGQFTLTRDDETIVAEADQPDEAPQALDPAEVAVWQPLVGEWAGFMSCGGSRSPFPVGVQLQIDAAGAGVISIEPYETNLGVPSASHDVEISMRQGQYLLKRGEWIVEGAGWGFDYTGTLSGDGALFTGRGQGCHSLVLARGTPATIDTEAVLAMSMPDFLSDREVPRIVAAAPAWLGEGEWLASGQCEAHPARIAFETEGADLAAMSSNGVRAVLQAAEGADFLFMDDDFMDDDETATQVWAASPEHLLLRNSATGPDCISIYGREPFSSAEMPVGSAVMSPEIVATTQTGREDGQPFGLAEVLGLRLGMPFDEALTTLVRIHAANVADVADLQNGLTHRDLAPGSWSTPEEAPLLSSAGLRLTWRERSDAGGRRVTEVSTLFGPDRDGEPVVVAIALRTENLRDDLEAAVVAALGTPGQDWRGRTSLWFEREDLTWAFGDEGDPACRLTKEEGDAPDVRVALEVDCGSFILADPTTLLIVDSTYLSGLGNGRAPRRTEPVRPALTASAGVALEEPTGDVAALGEMITEERPFRFNGPGLLFTAGFAATLIEDCSLDLGVGDYAELLSFVQTGMTTALVGTQYSNPDLGAAVGNQVGSGVAFGLGAVAAEQLRCGEPAATEAASFIVELIELNRSGGAGGGNTFLTSCSQTFSEAQCSCLAGLAMGVYPDIYDRTYSPDIIYNLIQSNPFLGLTVGMQCGISNY